jgi:hypothetical protein
MTGLVGVLALVVSAMCAYIALVVPQLVRVSVQGPRSVMWARVGAVVFFAGCAVTHFGIAMDMFAQLGGTTVTGMDAMGAGAGRSVAWSASTLCRTSRRSSGARCSSGSPGADGG